MTSVQSSSAPDLAPDIEVQRACRSPRAPASHRLRAFARAAMAATGRQGELTVRIVDEVESADLNSRYRGKPGPTNVLSFPLAASDPAGQFCFGDLAVCAPVVSREAREQGKTVEAHWAHMLVHGVLHLAGYDHQTDDQAQSMEDLERRILRGLGFGDPYAGDA